MSIEDPQCHCLSPLTFETKKEQVTCWCPRCKKRADADDGGFTIFVYGHGKTNQLAAADWRDAMRRF